MSVLALNLSMVTTAPLLGCPDLTNFFAVQPTVYHGLAQTRSRRWRARRSGSTLARTGARRAGASHQNRGDVDKGKAFEVVFVSSDKSEEEFASYHKVMLDR